MTTLIDEAANVTTWVEACWLDDLKPGWGEAAWIDGQQIALLRFADDTLFAVTQKCPGTGAQVMSRGIMGSRNLDGELVKTIASPLHKEVYRLDTGECLNADDVDLLVYPVRVESARVMVGLG
ncbi:nitrite reductase small subunit NirD [Zhihengliuella halotolerans]|uniref:nitrite reductase small subunit NirD n=1 Tax=Zhihengliuella halotolerans TaxID=370736 RepID=UPI000C7FD3F6|nr:nitrite reductase small subunit NirD [Zhihengliuella halotolerans]